jgi:hypothetical protein
MFAGLRAPHPRLSGVGFLPFDGRIPHQSSENDEL